MQILYCIKEIYETYNETLLELGFYIDYHEDALAIYKIGKRGKPLKNPITYIESCNNPNPKSWRQWFANKQYFTHFNNAKLAFLYKISDYIDNNNNL